MCFRLTEKTRKVTRRGKVRKGSEEQSQQKAKKGEERKKEYSSTRPAPETRDDESREQVKNARENGIYTKQYNIINHATFVCSTQPPRHDLVEKVRQGSIIKRQLESETNEQDEGKRNKHNRSR